MNPIISVLVEGFVPGLLVGGALLLVMPWLKRDSDWRLLPVAIVLALTAHWIRRSTLWPVACSLPSNAPPFWAPSSPM
jgi:cellulose synthase (UDP-forming)